MILSQYSNSIIFPLSLGHLLNFKYSKKVSSNCVSFTHASGAIILAALYKLYKKEHIYHFDHVNLSLILLRYFLFNISIDFQYYKTPYMNIKKDYMEQAKSLKSFYNKKKYQSKHYASPGNMMTLVYKKMK